MARKRFTLLLAATALGGAAAWLRRNDGHYLFAAFYQRRSATAEKTWLLGVREELLRDVHGEVLEVGAGQGANLPYYEGAKRVVLAEPDPAMRRRLEGKLDTAPVPVPVGVVDASVEELPFADRSFDTVVCTAVLCSVENPDRASGEMLRVLRPGGQLLFLEHVIAEPGARRDRQERLDPLWRRLFAGCRLTRDTVTELERAGFRIESLRTIRPSTAPKPTSPLIAGSAVRT